MWITFFYLCLVAQVYDQVTQRAIVQRVIKLAEKQWRTRIFTVFALGQVSPQRAASCLAQKYRASLAALGAAQHAMLHLHLAGLLIHVFNLVGSDSSRLAAS